MVDADQETTRAHIHVASIVLRPSNRISKEDRASAIASGIVPDSSAGHSRSSQSHRLYKTLTG